MTSRRKLREKVNAYEFELDHRRKEVDGLQEGVKSLQAFVCSLKIDNDLLRKVYCENAKGF